MNEPFAESPATSADAPSNEQAAKDLRAAADGNERERAYSPEEKARLLKEAATVKARELREAANERTIHFRDTAGENVQHFRSAANEQWQDTRLRLREFHADTESLIRQHPTHTVLAAAVTGFLVGLVIRR